MKPEITKTSPELTAAVQAEMKGISKPTDEDTFSAFERVLKNKGASAFTANSADQLILALVKAEASPV